MDRAFWTQGSLRHRGIEYPHNSERGKYGSMKCWCRSATEIPTFVFYQKLDVCPEYCRVPCISEPLTASAFHDISMCSFLQISLDSGVSYDFECSLTFCLIRRWITTLYRCLSHYLSGIVHKNLHACAVNTDVYTASNAELCGIEHDYRSVCQRHRLP